MLLFACRNWIECIIRLVQLAWLVWSVAFTDDGWRANLHGLHLVYDLICSAFQVCFLYLVSSALVFQWILDLSALFFHQLGIHLGILSTYLGPFSFALYIPAMHHIFQLPSYWSWVHCVHPYFRSWVQMCPTCTILSDSALQFRPWLAMMQCLIISFLDLLYLYSIWLA